MDFNVNENFWKLWIKNFNENEEDVNENNIDNNKGLICETFISKINIDLNIENQFLILASDGI